MAVTAPKIEFGLKEVHYAVINPDGSYGTPKAIKGAVSMSMDPAGSSTDFYADDINYYQVSSNQGYTGTLEVARGNREFFKECLASVEDSNGMLLEVADSQPKSVALMFEVATDQDPIKFVIYEMKFDRSSRTANTKSESSNPDTQSFSYTAVPKEFTFQSGGTSVTKMVTSGKLELSDDNKTVYDNFYNVVVTPGYQSA